MRRAAAAAEVNSPRENSSNAIACTYIVGARRTVSLGGASARYRDRPPRL